MLFLCFSDYLLINPYTVMIIQSSCGRAYTLDLAICQGQEATLLLIMGYKP